MTSDPASPALERLTHKLASYRFGLRLSEQGRVISVGDGIAWIRGLPSAAMDELLEFEDASHGLVFHLAADRLGAILLEPTVGLRSGAGACLTGRRLEIGVGDALLGRVIDPLGQPLDGLPPAVCAVRRELDALSPPLVRAGFRQPSVVHRQ